MTPALIPRAAAINFLSAFFTKNTKQEPNAVSK